jgi:hypothetical protein
VIKDLRSVVHAAMETSTANQRRNDRHLSAFNLGLILGKGLSSGSYSRARAIGRSADYCRREHGAQYRLRDPSKT